MHLSGNVAGVAFFQTFENHVRMNDISFKNSPDVSISILFDRWTSHFAGALVCFVKNRERRYWPQMGSRVVQSRYECRRRAGDIGHQPMFASRFLPLLDFAINRQSGHRSHQSQTASCLLGQAHETEPSKHIKSSRYQALSFVILTLILKQSASSVVQCRRPPSSQFHFPSHPLSLTLTSPNILFLLLCKLTQVRCVGTGLLYPSLIRTTIAATFSLHLNLRMLLHHI